MVDGKILHTNLWDSESSGTHILITHDLFGSWHHADGGVQKHMSLILTITELIPTFFFDDGIYYLLGDQELREENPDTVYAAISSPATGKTFWLCLKIAFFLLLNWAQFKLKTLCFCKNSTISVMQYLLNVSGSLLNTASFLKHQAPDCPQNPLPLK